MKRIVPAILLAMAIITTVATATDEEELFKQARQTLYNLDFEKARVLLKDLITQTKTSKYRTFGAREAALLSWRIYKNHDQAEKILLNSISFTERPAVIYLDLSNMERDRANYEKAKEYAAKAALFSMGLQDLHDAQLLWCKSVLAGYTRLPAENAKSSREYRELRFAQSIAEEMVDYQQGETDSSLVLLHTSLLTGDWPAVYNGWLSYFQTSDKTDPGRILAKAREKLTILKDLDQTIVPDDETLKKIMHGLIDSRLFEEARLVSIYYEPENLSPLLKDALIYADFLKSLQEITNEYYRQVALGKGNRFEYTNWFITSLSKVWEEAHISDKPFPVTPPCWIGSQNNIDTESLALVVDELMDTFGAYFTLGSTAGTYDLHYGHVVVSDDRIISMYQKSASIKIMQLDTMASNGYQSWAWNYESQHGGWAKPDAIYQVRPAYAAGPVLAWQKTGIPRNYNATMKTLSEFREKEAQLAQAEVFDFFETTSDLLVYSGLEQLLSEIKKDIMTESEIQQAFLAKVKEVTLDYSIFYHEGRHVIDQQDGITQSEQLEFTAKLSQLAFSEYPQLAFNGVYSANLSGDTAHGKANRRILRGFDVWMRKNHTQIKGYNPELAPMFQLHLLSAEQMRHIARSMDPLAQNQ